MSDTLVASTDLSTAEILRAAKQRISDRNHFVMGALAWNRQGRIVDPLAPDAWRWNARGAISAESGIRPIPWGNSNAASPGERLYALLDEASKTVSAANDFRFPNGTDLSDNLGHALTLLALDTAITLAESRP